MAVVKSSRPLRSECIGEPWAFGMSRHALHVGAHFAKPETIRKPAPRSTHAPRILGMLGAIRAAARFVGL